LGPETPAAPGDRCSLILHVLNDTDQAREASFPSTLPCRVTAPNFSTNSELKRIEPEQDDPCPVPARGFVRARYGLVTPVVSARHLIVEIQGIWPGRALLSFSPPVLTAPVPAAGKEVPEPKIGETPEAALPSDPVAFFKEHFYPHEPLYFIAGTESPNAKFQISLKYQVFTSEGKYARRVPELQCFYLGYTQTSLWDWSQPSAPFFDSSYKPELLYASDWVKPDRWAHRFGLRFQTGLQHESNGRDGESSRSLNIVYVKPTLAFGPADGFQMILMPRAWVYVGSLSDNPELAEYWGYAGLRMVLGWNQGLQLSALGRVGDRFDRGALQLDLTYPLWKIPLVRSSMFLHLQYFTGYGESLLEYNERSDAFRAGFSLFR
jgi:phospholipase A1